MTDIIERVATAIRSGLESSGFASIQANGPNGEEGLRQLFEVLAMDAVEAMPKKVWIYTNPNKQVGDKDHLKVFATEDAARAWFAENDPEGVAFEYEVQP